MADLEYAMPAMALRKHLSLYYLMQEDLPLFEDGERAAMAQLRFILDGYGVLHFANGTSRKCEGAFFVGPTSAAVRYEVHGPFRMIGMGVQASGWGALTGHNAADFVDDVIAADKIIPGATDILEALRQCSSSEDIIACADNMLTKIIEDAPITTQEFTDIVDDWLASHPSPNVCDLHQRSCLSERQLTRRVKQLYGMPPKYLSRKYRALCAARALIGADEDEADFLRSAFYDQSHMIRELKLFAGTTPGKLRDGEADIASMIDQRNKFDGRTSRLTTRT